MRAYVYESSVFVSMVLILIFAEVIVSTQLSILHHLLMITQGLYGLIVALILNTAVGEAVCGAN